MNFFEHQDRARQHTKRLVGLYLLSLLCIALSVYGAALVTSWMIAAKTMRHRFHYSTNPAYQFEHGRSPGSSRTLRFRDPDTGAMKTVVVPETGKVDQSKLASTADMFALWQPKIFLMSALPTLLVIGGLSWFKVQALKQGGALVAQELGGRLLLPETASSPNEQQLLNVVEEMAIAAGIPAPYLYVLDNEAGINAFAAGYSTNDAVIGVTRGCLDQFTRDELQGVIGHELSHILNGDMRLNMKLIGAIHGILFLYLLGRILIEFRSRDHNYIAFLGLALMVIGGLGQVFARLIQSAVSRQREFLADASSVQFTRNPEAIASALGKIETNGYRSLVTAPYAEEMSHLFFGEALRSSWFSGDWFATHPPLKQRIQRVSAYAGRFQAQTSSPKLHPRASSRPSSQPPISGASMAMGFAGASTQSRSVPEATTPEATTQSATQSTTRQITAKTAVSSGKQSGLLGQLPESLQTRIQDRSGAIALVYALLLDPENPQHQAHQVNGLRSVELPEIIDDTLEISQDLQSIKPKQHLALLELTIPILRETSAPECQQLLKRVQALAMVDKRWSLKEFVVYLILWYQLQPCLGQALEKPMEQTSLEAVWQDCWVVMAALAQVGQNDRDRALYTARSGLQRLPGSSQQVVPDTLPTFGFSELKQSLDRLRAISAKLKQALIDAAAYMVLLDNTVTVPEAELLRAMAIALNCPLPPLLNRP